jgi:DNA primase|nr:MAG TPA: DNA primase [Caudoviricetes sp.]
MDTTSLKEYIFNNNKVEFVLDKIGCKSIKYHSSKNFYSATNYNGDNTGAVNVYNTKYLLIHNWTRESEFDDVSDIISLVQYNKKCSFVDAVKYLHNILGLELTPYKKEEKKEKLDPLAIFKNAISRHRAIVDVAEIQAIKEEAINDYVPLLYIDWLREGVMPWAAKKFGLAYSYKYHRVVIPIRYWLDGTLVGFNQRTTVENYEELGIRKYFLTASYRKSLNLYGLWENREEIEDKRTVVICESEKSVLKRYSRNDGTCVALQGKKLSDEQRRIIIGLNVNEVIIALDNDVPIEEVRHICEQFYHIRNVSYVKDRWNLLGDKDAPADAENKVYNFLMKHRVRYDESEHQKYLSSLKKK